MKKRFLLFFLVFLVMALAYFIYSFYKDDYLPEKVRDHYDDQQKSSFQSFAETAPKKKFVPRKEFHENTEYKRSDNEVVSLSSFPSGELASLQESIKSLEFLNLECEQKFNELMPPNQIIDPVNSSYFQNKEKVILNLERGITLYNRNEARAKAMEFIDDAATALSAYDQVSAADFARVLRAPLVCRQSNLSVLFESVIELAEDGQFSDAEKEQIISFMANEIALSLERDYLQDNVLMNLTLLKGVALLAGLDQSFYIDLENIFKDLQAGYSSIYDNTPKSEMIKNPGDVFNDYRYRQSQAAQRVLDLTLSYFEGYIEE